MEKYQGDQCDEPIGGGSYVKENKFGSEINNFHILNQPIELSHLDLSTNENSNEIIPCCHGYVEVQGKDESQIHIEKLGAMMYEEYVTGILVVWLAKHPKEGGIRVVGWYRNATVFRWSREPDEGSPGEIDNCLYNIEARASDCVLIPVNKRIIRIPRATKNNGGMGHSNIWYAQGDKNRSIVEKIKKYIDKYETDHPIKVDETYNYFARRRKERIIEINSSDVLEKNGPGTIALVKEKIYPHVTRFEVIELNDQGVILLDKNMQIGTHIQGRFDFENKVIWLLPEEEELGKIVGFIR
jgi:hypothetical protein